MDPRRPPARPRPRPAQERVGAHVRDALHDRRRHRDRHLERKARWLFWRPISAVREAAADGNPHTTPDTAWLPLVNTPPYPDQPSGLSALSAAMAESLERVFGRKVRFSVASISSNTTRSYRSFADAVDEVVDARVYSGIHFRKADVDGEVLGREVARDGLEHNFERD